MADNGHPGCYVNTYNVIKYRQLTVPCIHRASEAVICILAPLDSKIAEDPTGTLKFTLFSEDSEDQYQQSGIYDIIPYLGFDKQYESNKHTYMDEPTYLKGIIMRG